MGSPLQGLSGQLQEPVLALLELGGDRLQAGASVSQRHARPPGQVAIAGRGVADQVAARQLGQGLVAVHGRRLGAEPVAGENVGMLLADHRAADENPPHAGAEAEVRERLARGREPLPLQPLAQLSARQGALVRQRPLDPRQRPLAHLGRDPFDAEPAGALVDQRRSRHRVQPGVVLAAHQLQRAAVEPGDQQRALLAQASGRRRMRSAPRCGRGSRAAPRAGPVPAPRAGARRRLADPGAVGR